MSVVPLLIVEARVRLRLHRLRDMQQLMLRQALDHRIPGLQQDYLPNRLQFGWHPDDMARWSQLTRHVAAETAQILGARAREADFLLVGDIAVTIIEDPAAAPGRPTLRAGSRTAPADAGATAPGATTRMGAGASPAAATVLLRSLVIHRPQAAQERVRLVDGLTVGRRDGVDIRLTDGIVSSLHARFDVSGAGASVVDLGSANGTFVNGRRIERATPLQTGDCVSFGDERNRAELVAG